MSSAGTGYTTIDLPILLRNATYATPSDVENFRVRIRAFPSTEDYMLTLPHNSEAGFLYNIGNGILRWEPIDLTPSYTDAAFEIKNVTDQTKKLKFDVSPVAHLITRTITMPNVDINLNVVDRLKTITASQVTQITNMGVLTVSSGQWMYISAMNQGIATTSNVQFAKIGVAQAPGTDVLEATGNIKATGTLTCMAGGLTVGSRIPSDTQWSYLTGLDQGLVTTGNVQFAKIGIAQAPGTEVLEATGNIKATGTLTCMAGGLTVGARVPTDTQWSYLTGLDQALLTTGNVQFAKIGVAQAPGTEVLETTGNIKATGTLTCMAGGLTVGTRTPSDTQLGYVVGMDQGVAVANNVTFAQVSCTTSLKLKETGVGTDYITLQAPAAVTTAYAITLPDAAPTGVSLLEVDTSGNASWFEEVENSSNINLYQYPATYSISGGGTALGASIALNGGGTLGAPAVYEITDSLSYQGGIDLTNINYIVVRGAVGQRPIIVVDNTYTSGFYIDYNTAHGTTTSVTIGNMDIDVTAGTGVANYCGFLCIRQGTGLNTDTVAGVYLKDVLVTNTDYTTVTVSRSGISFVGALPLDAARWVTTVRIEDCKFRDLSPGADTGCILLIGVSDYIGKRNYISFPNFAALGSIIQTYQVQSSDAKEYYSMICGTMAPYYSATTQAFLAKCTVDTNSYCGYGVPMNVEFYNCRFSNSNSSIGAIEVEYKPQVGWDMTMNCVLSGCIVEDSTNSGLFIGSDSINHGANFGLTIEECTFDNCYKSVLLDGTFISTFSAISIEKNNFARYFAPLYGFGSSLPLSTALSSGVKKVVGHLYKYFNLADYSTWAADSSPFFQTTATFALGAWYNLTLTDGNAPNVPATAYTAGFDLGESVLTTLNANGTIAVGDSGLYRVHVGVSAQNGAAAVTMSELIILINGETPPATAPSAGQAKRILGGIEASATLANVNHKEFTTVMRLTAGDFLTLAYRWVFGGVAPQSYYFQAVEFAVERVY